MQRRIDLVPVDPPKYGIGYWLGETHTGRGLATAACQEVLELARDQLAATDLFAGGRMATSQASGCRNGSASLPSRTFRLLPLPSRARSRLTGSDVRRAGLNSNVGQTRQ